MKVLLDECLPLDFRHVRECNTGEGGYRFGGGSVPYVFLSPRTERTSPRPRGPDEDSAKFWLDPVSLAVNLGFRPAELRRVQRLVVENRAPLLEKWHERFPS
jgi:hypothetical protein